jgi:hypothetical protein
MSTSDWHDAFLGGGGQVTLPPVLYAYFNVEGRLTNRLISSHNV